MPVTVDESLVKTAYDTIKENASLMESKENKEKPETIVHRYQPRFTVNNSVFMKYLKDNGISNDVVSKITNLEQAWNTASAKFAFEEIKDLEQTFLSDKEFMKAAGPKYVNATVFTSLKDGKQQVTVNAYVENRNPRATGEEDAITKSYGTITVRHKVTKAFPTEFAEKISVDMEKMLKNKF